MRFLINERIYFEMAIEAARQERIARYKFVRRLLKNQKLRINNIERHIEFMRDLRKFKKCGGGRP